MADRQQPGLVDSLGYPLGDKPHRDALFDPMWRSRHSPAPLDGWVFEYRCAARRSCGTQYQISATAAAEKIAALAAHGCPECGAALERVCDVAGEGEI